MKLSFILLNVLIYSGVFAGIFKVLIVLNIHCRCRRTSRQRRLMTIFWKSSQCLEVSSWVFPASSTFNDTELHR